ncbi:uncharacterized protein LOC127248751 [Andrographis paniculata]|uniref:uncharacterized protein LOC127248751 n=1 Tax=Andrographis paniculata TaxID=175694 RepID=UPI0021E88F0B|nr:uncharacterized protein LOC127248751 [Andrographis paniculata]
MSSTVLKMPTTQSMINPPMILRNHKTSAPHTVKSSHRRRPEAAGFRRSDFRVSAACRFPLSAVAMDSSTEVSDSKEEEEKRINNNNNVLLPELMPEHVAIIMDGHGRWAKARGLPREKGHFAGHANLKHILLSAQYKFGIKVLTVYAFSTENWKRSEEEIKFLMGGYEGLIRSYVMEFIQRNGLRFSAIGDKSRLPESMQSAIREAEESSKNNKGLHFVMALNYSGRLDITQAMKKIARKVEKGSLAAEDVSDELLQQHLMTSSIDIPDPDLLIRTSGERRLSNFLLWQLAYAEFYVIDKMFPDLDEVDLAEALVYFQGRQRRFGGRSKEDQENHHKDDKI